MITPPPPPAITGFLIGVIVTGGLVGIATIGVGVAYIIQHGGWPFHTPAAPAVVVAKSRASPQRMEPIRTVPAKMQTDNFFSRDHIRRQCDHMGCIAVV